MNKLEKQNSNQNLIETTADSMLQRPRLFKVVLLNDDYTPMEFVVGVLKSFFNMGEEDAVRVMLQVHHLGSAICGIYTRDIAETKVAQVIKFAHSHEHPLLCCMEVA